MAVVWIVFLVRTTQKGQKVLFFKGRCPMKIDKNPDLMFALKKNVGVSARLYFQINIVGISATKLAGCGE